MKLLPGLFKSNKITVICNFRYVTTQHCVLLRLIEESLYFYIGSLKLIIIYFETIGG